MNVLIVYNRSQRLKGHNEANFRLIEQAEVSPYMDHDLCNDTGQIGQPSNNLNTRTEAIQLFTSSGLFVPPRPLPLPGWSAHFSSWGCRDIFDLYFDYLLHPESENDDAFNEARQPFIEMVKKAFAALSQGDRVLIALHSLFQGQFCRDLARDFPACPADHRILWFSNQLISDHDDVNPQTRIEENNEQMLFDMHHELNSASEVQVAKQMICEPFQRHFDNLWKRSGTLTHPNWSPGATSASV